MPLVESKPLRVSFEDYKWPTRYDGPLDHQIETTKFLIRNKRCFILNDMGTGKTLSALWACDFLMCNSKIRRVLIVTPLSTIMSVWGNSIFQHIFHRKYIILHGGDRKKRIEMLDRAADFFIINHDGIKSIEVELIRAKFDVVIIDELTAYKTHTANRSKSMKRIADTCKAVWGMTGNPTPNEPAEAFGQAKIVNPYNKDLPQYYTRFKDKVMYRLNQFMWIPRENAEAEVAKILSPAIRYERDECIDIPECIVQDMELEMSKEQSRVYNELRDEFISTHKAHEITSVNAASQAIKLLQVSSGVVYDENHEDTILDCKPKLNALWDIYCEIRNRKIIVAASFKGCIRMLENFFHKKHSTKTPAKCAVITGDVPVNRRTIHFADFQDGDLNILIIQPKAASHGLTLTAAHNLVWFTPIPSGEVYQQFNARITRPGQTSKQLIIRMANSPAEKKVYKALDTKQRMSDALLELFV